MRPSPRVLICDRHAGCQAAIWHTLKAVGITADVLSLSGHAHLLESLGVPKDRILKRPRLWKKAPGLPLIGRLSTLRLQTYDLAICAFPPPFYRELLRSHVAKKILLVAGHRIDLGIKTDKERRKYFLQLERDVASKQIHIAALNSYDAAYLKSEAGITAESLGCVRQDLLAITERAPTGERLKQALVGPSHVMESRLYQDMEEFFKKNAPQSTPQSIRALYQKYTYEQLAQHSSCVVLPYSIFSISIEELFALGLRVLVPSDRMLNHYNILNDVKLWPIYTSHQKAADFKDAKNPHSPNTIKNGIPEQWLCEASWNERAGTERWDSFEELRDRLNQDSEARVSSNLLEEQMRAKKLRIIWSKKIGQILSI